MICASVGSSRLEDPRHAGRQAAEEALCGLEGSADFALVFATAAYPQAELVQSVAGILPGAQLSGCSGEGIIAGAATHEVDFAVAVLAVHSDSVTFEPFLMGSYHQDPADAGRRVGRFCTRSGSDDLVCLVVLPDGLRGNVTELLESLATSLPASVPIVGGGSADGQLFERTFQYFNGQVTSDAVAGFVVRGAASLEHAVSHGCMPVGLDHVVTRADRGWVYEIDGRPPWALFQEYLDGDPEELTAEGVVYLCLGLDISERNLSGCSPYVIRAPMRLDRQQGALFFPGGGVTTGARVRLTRRDAELIRGSASDCARRVQHALSGRRPALVLQFDCAGRGRLLFGDHASEQILKPLQDGIGHAIPWTGFHSFGEIAPLSREPFFHNYSVAVCALCETPSTDEA